MTVQVSAPNTTGVSGAITCIRKLRINGSALLGNKDIYFFLTATKHLYYSFDPMLDDPVELSLANIPFLATATFSGMDVYSVDSPNHPKYPAVFLYGRDSAGVIVGDDEAESYCFVAILQCIQLDQTPAVRVEWLEASMRNSLQGAWTARAGSPVEYSGFNSSAAVEPYSMVYGSLLNGVIFADGHRLSAPFDGSFEPVVDPRTVQGVPELDYSMYQCFPAVGVVGGVSFVYPITRATDNGQYFPWLLGAVANPDPAEPIIYTFLDNRIDSDTNEDLRYGLGSVTPGSNAGYYVDAPVDENTPGEYVDFTHPLTSSDLQWVAGGGVAGAPPTAVVFGWGLSNSDVPPLGVGGSRVYGGPSIMWVENTGYIRVFGDGAGTGQFSVPAGDPVIESIAFGHYGSMGDITASLSPTTTPFYNKGVVAVSGRYVKFSPDGLDWSAAPVLTLPERDPTFVASSVVVYGFKDHPENDWTDHFILATVFKGAPGEGPSSHVRAVCYSSPDGETWTEECNYSLTTALATESSSVGGFVAGVPPTVAITHGQIFMAAAATDLPVGEATATGLIAVRYFDGEGYGWASSDTVIMPVQTAVIPDPQRADEAIHWRSLNPDMLGGRLDSYTWGGSVVSYPDTRDVSLLMDGVFDRRAPEWSYLFDRNTAGTRDWLADYSLGGGLVSDAAYIVGYYDALSSAPTARPVCFLNGNLRGLLAYSMGPGLYGGTDNAVALPVYLSSWAPAAAAADLPVSLATYASDTVKGTALVLRNRNGLATQLKFLSHPVYSPNSPYGNVASRLAFFSYNEFEPCSMGLGFHITDLYLDFAITAPGTEATWYVCSEHGEIFRLTNGATCGLVLVTSYFLGVRNLHLTRTGGVWVATYDGLDIAGDFVNTCVEYSVDMITWSVGVASGDTSHASLLSPAKDLLQLGSKGICEAYIPNSAEAGVSVF